VKIDLLGIGDAIAAAGVEKLPGSAVKREVADIFNEHEGTFAELLFDHESRLVGVFVGRSVAIGALVCVHPSAAPAGATCKARAAAMLGGHSDLGYSIHLDAETPPMFQNIFLINPKSTLVSSPGLTGRSSNPARG